QIVEVLRGVRLQTHASASWVRLSRNARPGQILMCQSDDVVGALAVTIPELLVAQCEVYPARIRLRTLRGKIRQPLAFVFLAFFVPVMPILMVVALSGFIPHFDIRLIIALELFDSLGSFLLRTLLSQCGNLFKITWLSHCPLPFPRDRRCSAHD